jgi:hypothetical protein
MSRHKIVVDVPLTHVDADGRPPSLVMLHRIRATSGNKDVLHL